ncbi:MAG: FG-GAP repeat domain-containing protein, partial [Planctomycetota bacterium]
DGDGDLDAFFGNEGLNRLSLNAGTGVFADATSQLPAFVDFTRAIGLGDVDGDGDLDALIGNYAGPNPLVGGPERLHLNNGSGSFGNAPAQLPSSSDFTYAVALGDVDGDADLDALIGNYPSSNRLLLNGGTGVFVDATNQITPVASFARALALGDVDGDGDLDAVLSGYQRLLLNSGGGFFTDASGQVPTTLNSARALALGDVDEDGDLDVVTGHTGLYAPQGVQNRLYLNNGSGLFADATAGLPPLLDATLAVALGDVDGDGDLDAVFGNFEERSRLPVLNLTRQLAWRGLPRIGKPLVLEIRGPANVGWQLAAALGPASLPFPPYGTLRLEPATLSLVTAGALDPEGRASVSFAVPASPALLGVSVYWQALLALPARLTNLEVSTFTNL